MDISLTDMFNICLTTMVATINTEIAIHLILMNHFVKCICAGISFVSKILL